MPVEDDDGSSQRTTDEGLVSFPALCPLKVNIFHMPVDRNDVFLDFWRTYHFHANYLVGRGWTDAKLLYLGVDLDKMPPTEGDLKLEFLVWRKNNWVNRIGVTESVVKRLIHSLRSGLIIECTTNVPFCHTAGCRDPRYMESLADLFINLENACWHCGKSEKYGRALKQLGKHPDDTGTIVLEQEDEMFNDIEL
ncbi:hypothetical protein KEM56_007730 [Ascosphaera pollenicola]|nr:hypothetical protein KEM56_007730 [Ascosphaera pollenicola]